MEYSQTQALMMHILILMEYSQTQALMMHKRFNECLNPYSNGILTDYMCPEDLYKEILS